MKERIFVSKGGQIGVFSTNGDFVSNLPVVKNLEDGRLNPKKLLMTQQDTRMLLLDNEFNKGVYEFDLEKGKVVREYRVDQSNPISDICHE